MADSQRTRSRNWVKEDVERLVHWMEENQQSLQGKASVWHKDVKEQVFAENEEITVKRIKEKAQNMKNAWRTARKIWEQSEFGAHAEVESKCPLFWRLDEIWGSRPNTAPNLILDPTQTQGPNPLVNEDVLMLTQEPRHDEDDEELEGEETPPRRLSPITGSVTGSSQGPQRRLPQIRRHSKTGILRGIMRDRGAIELLKEEKRLKLKRELHIEKMKAEDGRLELQLKSQERIARIQADGQVRQFQFFMDMMSVVTSSQRLGSFSSSTQLTDTQRLSTLSGPTQLTSSQQLSSFPGGASPPHQT